MPGQIIAGGADLFCKSAALVYPRRKAADLPDKLVATLRALLSVGSFSDADPPRVAHRGAPLQQFSAEADQARVGDFLAGG